MRIEAREGRRGRLLIPMACVAAATLALAGTAVADRIVRTDRQGDARGSGPMRIDLKAGSASHASGKLVHTIDSFGRLHGGPFSPVALNINTSPRRGPEYSVQAFPEGTLVTRARDGRRTGRATYRRVDRNTLTFKFSARAIGRPRSYGWQVSVEGSGDRRVDALPNRGFVRHDLTLP